MPYTEEQFDRLPEDVLMTLFDPEIDDIFVRDVFPKMSEEQGAKMSQMILDVFFRAIRVEDFVEQMQQLIPDRISSRWITNMVLGYSFLPIEEYLETDIAGMLQKNGAEPARYGRSMTSEKVISKVRDLAEVKPVDQAVSHRLDAVLRTFISGVRDDVQTLESLMRSFKTGGLGLDENSAQTLIDVANDYVGSLLRRGIAIQSDAPQSSAPPPAQQTPKNQTPPASPITHPAQKKTEPALKENPKIDLNPAKKQTLAPRAPDALPSIKKVSSPSKTTPKSDVSSTGAELRIDTLTPGTNSGTSVKVSQQKKALPEPVSAVPVSSDQSLVKSSTDVPMVVRPIETAVVVSPKTLTLVQSFSPSPTKKKKSFVDDLTIDDNEIATYRNRISREEKKRTDTYNTKIKTVVDDIVQTVAVGSSEDARRRLAGFVELYLRGVRTEQETQVKCVLSTEKGGAGFDQKQCDTVMALVRKRTADFHDFWKQQTDFEKARYVAKQQEKIMPSAASTANDISSTSHNDIKNSSGRIAVQSDRRHREEEVSIETDEGLQETSQAPAPVNLPSLSEPPATKLAGESQQEKRTPVQAVSAPRLMVDVHPAPKLIGPIDELRGMTVEDFRYLSRDPKEAALRIKDKIDLLKEQSYEHTMKAKQAWESSVVNRLYFDMLRETLDGVVLGEIVARRTSAKQPSLTQPEFQAITELNRQLRYG